MFDELSARTRAVMRRGAEGAERLRGQWLATGREIYGQAIRDGVDLVARTESELEALGRAAMGKGRELTGAVADRAAAVTSGARRGVRQAVKVTRRVATSLGEQAAAGQAMEREIARATPSAVGKIWNGPNTIVGLLYGGAGHLAGEVARTRPYVTVDANAIQFRNNPFGGVGAITLGNTTTYRGEPWKESKTGLSVDEHERQHTVQGEQLGPFYLPSNLLGGGLAVLRDGDWHGPSNWNERGPQAQPARPW